MGRTVNLLLLAVLAISISLDAVCAQRGGTRGGGRGRPVQGGGAVRPVQGGGAVRPGTAPRQPTSGISSGPTEEGDDGPPCQTDQGVQGSCRELAHCVFQFDSLEHLEKSLCQLSPEITGVCCPRNIPESEGVSPVNRPTARRRPGGNVQMPAITRNDIDVSGRRVLAQKDELDKLEAELVRRGLTVKRGSPQAFHLAFFGEKSLAQQVGQNGLISVETTSILARRFNLTSIQGREGLPRFDLTSSVVSMSCPRKPRCPSTKYRSADGSCNNRDNPDWGKSFTAFNRFLPPDYADGISLPRIAADRGPLPSPRAVSGSATPDKDVPHPLFALVVMQWAQFLDHDFSLAAITRTRTGQGILCCEPEILQNPSLRHPACMEIPIPKDDKFYSQYGQTCMEFVRSLPAPRPGCSLGPKEVLNQLTSYLDGSQVYGSTEEEMRRLRAFKGGRMLVLRYNNHDLLPREVNRTEECAEQQADLFCFMAGDERVNEQISLTAMHTVWVREHNRIAGELAKFNPGWTDEIIFQETRRIVAAEIQHITYNEFLPLLIGRRVMKAFGLLLRPFGYSDDYDPGLNPTVANGFATAAYRYGHTLVQGKVNLIEETGRVAQTVPLSTQFFNPAIIYGPGNYDRLLRGLTRQPAQTFDRFVTDQLTNHLFQRPENPFGLDLIALNIQRGRDNGIPGYNAWREFCGFKPFRTFDEMQGILHPSSINTFRRNYRSPDDVDLFPAGVGEFSLPDATLGPTFACLAGEMFRRFKAGDRFFYENGEMESSFTRTQLTQIRRVSLSRILCDNSDNIQALQPIAFIRATSWNPRVSCKSAHIPRMNLAAWKNEPVWA